MNQVNKDNLPPRNTIKVYLSTFTGKGGKRWMNYHRIK